METRAARGRRAKSRDSILVQAIVLVLVGAALVALAVFVLPIAIVSADDVRNVPDRLDLQNQVRGTLLQGLGGAFLFLTAFFTYRQMANAREQLEQGRQQLESTQRHQREQANRDERGQITERFSRAIDHLGEEANLVARLGGIYALETIARDNDTMAQLVEEVLCAFIRERAPWPPSPGQPPAETPPEELPQLRERLPDVAAALLVLTRRVGDPDPFRDRLWPLDLSEVDLRRAGLAPPPPALPSGQLVKGPVRRSNLRRAFLAGSHLTGARLDGADLTGADLGNADLRRASLVGAYLEDAVLVGARLEGAMLSDAHLAPEVPNVVSYDIATIWPSDLTPD